jgi:hypothetical protein
MKRKFYVMQIDHVTIQWNPVLRPKLDSRTLRLKEDQSFKQKEIFAKIKSKYHHDPNFLEFSFELQNLSNKQQSIAK